MNAPFNPSFPSADLHEEVGGRLEPALWNTFYLMEMRRLQRQAYGRQVAHSIWTTAFEVSMFLGLFMYGLATIRMRLLGSDQKDSLGYLLFPILLTIGVGIWALYQSVTTRENVPLVWGKTWAWLLVCWAFWLYQPAANCHISEGASTFLFGESAVGQAVFVLFCCLELTTLLLWFLVVKIYPVLAGQCRSHAALRLFWRVRSASARPGWYSYRPNGVCCSPKRRHFQYQGERDESGRPHGHGVWRDNSYHGEVLDGEWRDGVPVPPFMSRVFGSGAITMGLRVGYGTVRPEGISETWFMAVRPQTAQLRFGVVSVECSVAGGFLSFLPQVNAHHDFATSEAAVSELQGVAEVLVRRCSSSVSHSGSDAFLESGGVESLSERDSTSSASARAFDGLPPGSPAPPRGCLTTALVFVHGYNCPIDWACMRVAQLSSLGKLSPHFMPFVFSWPAGRIASFRQVLQDLPAFAADLPDFLAALRDAGVQEVHLAAHSLGCELITAALPQLDVLVESSGSGGGRLQISTVTFFNATCPEPTFTAEMLPRLLRICGRLTLYCNRDDVALISSDKLFGRGKAIGRCTDKIDYESARVDVVDCTSMDSNVNGVRHSYFDLNAHVVADFQELLQTQRSASRRSRLVHTSMDERSNVFAFLAPPAFVSW